MRYYPVFLALEGRRALVVGGGAVAERKIAALLEYGAEVAVVTRTLTATLQEWADNGRLLLLGEDFEPGQLAGAFLVIAATDDWALNSRISVAARERGLLVNAVDQPEDCTFILPAVVRRGDLVLAVSTSGRSPALAKQLRQRLEALFGQEYAVFLELMGRVRVAVLALGLPQAENSRLFHAVAASDALDAVGRGDWPAVAGVLESILPAKIDVQALCRGADGPPPARG